MTEDYSHCAAQLVCYLIGRARGLVAGVEILSGELVVVAGFGGLHVEHVLDGDHHRRSSTSSESTHRSITSPSSREIVRPARRDAPSTNS